MSQKPLRIAIAGMGTVGSATAALLRRNADLLTQRCGRGLEVVALSSRTNRAGDFSDIAWVDTAQDLATHPTIDVVVETIGGANGAAHELVSAALANKKHVVTANKALIATHGTALAALAEKSGVALCFEAAVAGGIPVLKTLREGLAANRISEVHGILNGTANFILTAMRLKGLSFAAALQEAQSLGYAEADPGFDIDGTDSAHKLAILAAIAFGRVVDFAGVAIEGIRKIEPIDIEFAGELGYRIKLLGSARQTEDGVLQRVAPCMVPAVTPIAAVDGVEGAVAITGDTAGKILLVGQGAGGDPTASSIVADLVDIARGHTTPAFGIPTTELAPANPSDPAASHSAFYLRLKVEDKPGVVADISAIVHDEGISLESVLQRGPSTQETLPLVLTTHQTQESTMRRAVRRIEALRPVTQTPCLIRIEGF